MVGEPSTFGEARSDHLQPANRDARKAREDFWIMSGDLEDRRHVMLREQLYVKESAFPTLVKYIDIVRHTKANLDIEPEESSIDD